MDLVFPRQLINQITASMAPLVVHAQATAMGLKGAVEDYIESKTPKLSLDAAGLVALADITTVQERTALTGTSSLLDLLILVPGIHLQQKATGLNGGEYPACAAMTTGYVFRVENPATVYYLQKVGRTGELTTLFVTKATRGKKKWYGEIVEMLFPIHNVTTISVLTYLTAVFLAVLVLTLLVLSNDRWGVSVVFILMLARLCNIVIIRRRSKLGWAGALEPGVKGDLLILLSQDRWIRIRGYVDDLKAVTSGQWLRDKSKPESWISAFSTIIVFLDAALVSNVGGFGKLLILGLMIGSVGLLAISNTATHELHMHGFIIGLDGPRRRFVRRLDLAKTLIEETGRDDWALRLGMINKSGQTRSTVETSGVVAM